MHHGLLGVHLLRSGVGYFLDDWCDVSGAIELDLGQTVLISFYNTLNTYEKEHASYISSHETMNPG